jgi:hypothetical protein
MIVYRQLVNDTQILDILNHYHTVDEDVYMIKSHKKQIDKLINYSNIFYCDLNNKFLRDVANNIIDENENLYSIHFVSYTIGDSCEKHIDRASYGTYIIILTDDYDGGELLIDDIDCKAKKGDVIYFNGNKEHHQVNKITRGIRNVLVLWTGNRRKGGLI